MAAMTCSQKMESVRTWFQTVTEYLRVKQRGEAVIAFAKERPVAATLIGVVVATSFLPAIAFVSFVATFLVIGIVILLIIEGTAVMSAIVILFFALFGSMIASVFIGMFLLSSLVAGRFTWRLTSPLRTKMAVRLGMCNGATMADNKTAPVIPEEKGQLEMAPEAGFAPKAAYEDDYEDDNSD